MDRRLLGTIRPVLPRGAGAAVSPLHSGSGGIIAGAEGGMRVRKWGTTAACHSREGAALAAGVDSKALETKR